MKEKSHIRVYTQTIGVKYPSKCKANGAICFHLTAWHSETQHHCRHSTILAAKPFHQHVKLFMAKYSQHFNSKKAQHKTADLGRVSLAWAAGHTWSSSMNNCYYGQHVHIRVLAILSRTHTINHSVSFRKCMIFLYLWILI